MDKFRKKGLEHDHLLLRLEQTVQTLENREKMQQARLDNHGESLVSHLAKLNELSYQKHDARAFEVDKEALDSELFTIKTDAANHANHFAMVENFIEKYIPVRIQSQISFTLQQVLPEKALGLLSEYEKGRFKEMHQILLEDDGIP